MQKNSIVSQPSARTLAQWLHDCTKLLTESAVTTPRLDTLVLTEYCLNHDRAWILAHPEFKLTATQIDKLKNLLNRRALHEPLAYILERQEFYGAEFKITSSVMQPRPESEAFIDLLRELIASHELTIDQDKIIEIADVGCGSGVLGITAALQFPNCRVTLLDIDKNALNIAKFNVDKFTLNISTVESDLLSASNHNYTVLLCNLPYVPDKYPLVNRAAQYEPPKALFGGKDGLDVYRKLFNQIQKRPEKPLYILSESLVFQHQEMTLIAHESGYKAVKTLGLVQTFRLSQTVR